jgi:hypothetical protein
MDIGAFHSILFSCQNRVKTSGRLLGPKQGPMGIILCNLLMLARAPPLSFSSFRLSWHPAIDLRNTSYSWFVERFRLACNATQITRHLPET